MQFENLRVNRVVIHEVFQRHDDRSIQPPVLAEALERLSPEALGEFRLRMTEALAGQTQSLQMRIIKHDSASFIAIAEEIISSSDIDFLAKSKIVALRLAEAQIARRIPGGVLIVFDGTVGVTNIPFLSVIKAETQAGFRRLNDGGQAAVEFLKNIFLTPATRLYKIGMMVFDDRTQTTPSGRQAFVFDSNISLSNREAAAAYFYEGFLGCAFPSDGPYETAKFFDLTKEFVLKSDLEPEQKRNTIDSLYVFVRDEQAPTFTTDQFSERFLPSDMRDPYKNFMLGRKFTPNAVVRDVSRMGRRLHRRKLKFGSDIELSASPEALSHKITIEAIEGDIDSTPTMWTRVTIKESLTGEQ